MALSRPSRRLPGAAALLGVLFVMVAGSSAAAQSTTVLVAEVDGPITPVVALQMDEAIDQAVDEGHEALLVMLDTPGGLDVSMRDIVQAFLGAEVPVVVYVAPEGARAASAGTFITMAAHVAAMAPATSIGAATPVDLEGGEITEKVINDAVAFAVAVAERRGRDAEFAESAVREGTSITASQAEESGVVDLVAEDMDELLERIHGREVVTGAGSVTLDTRDALAERFELTLFRSVLARLADPNLAFIFLSLGTLAIIYEVANPGVGLGGVVGVILLVLAFFSLSVLPIQGAGIALLLLGIGLLVAELFVPGVGVLAAGGSLALLLSGLFLFEGSLAVRPAVLLPSVIVLGGGSVLAGRAVLRARRRPPVGGIESLIGRELVVEEVEGSHGSAFLDGAWWDVRPRQGELERGAHMRVVAVEGLHLVVEPEEGVDGP